MVALLDVNVLIALLDEGHMHHAAATRWLSDHLGAGWASCPLTQNGCIRILSQTAYPNRAPAAEEPHAWVRRPAIGHTIFGRTQSVC